MDEQKDDGLELTGQINHIRNKLENLPVWKKVMFLLCAFAILGSLTYIGTMTRIDTVKYADGCTEVFVNGEINGSYCNASRDMLEKKGPPYYMELPKV